MLLTAALAIGAGAASVQVARAAPEGQGSTAFFDDFDGPAGSAPNPKFWTVPDWGADHMYLDGDSHLVLKVTGTYDNPVTSQVTSKGKVDLGYGTFSARIKTAAGRGLWPAFYLLGSNDVTNPWPACGEIDVIELISDPNYYCTIHAPIAGTSNHQQQQFSGPLWMDPTAGFHTYWCTHLANSITFGIDAANLGTMTPSMVPAGSSWPYNQPFYMILNHIVGDGIWCPKPDATTPLPASMLVDWVKWEAAA